MHPCLHQLYEANQDMQVSHSKPGFKIYNVFEEKVLKLSAQEAVNLFYQW